MQRIYLSRSMDAKLQQHMSHEPSKLPYQLIKQITNDFDDSRILGSGGFGTVYKGAYENGGEIAVKVLHNTIGRLDDNEFQKEFDNLRGLKHPNIVELVGFCNESEEELVMFEGKQVTAERLHMALCFEYAHNGSLNKHISDEKTGLTWHTRYRIIKGICEGLKYLREGLESPIMHFDLKPENILLDKRMVPKITDFGLSKLFGEENTRKTLSSAGTIGYCPPEYIKHQIISREFDIFSLGVTIVRIVTGHQGYNSVVEMPTQKSVKLVHESWRKRLRGTLRHTSLEVCCNQVKICIEIALNCLNSNRQERPTIQHIVSCLNETEKMIGDMVMQNEQFYQDDGEPTLPSGMSNITINSEPSSENFLAVEPKFMPLSLLKEMTDDFSHERLIGSGTYGKVYKGVDGDGKVIAVRKLYNIAGFNETLFKNETAILKKLRHQNIVQFIGYCNETEQKVVEYGGRIVIADIMHLMTCFEYLGISGSLDRYISQDMDSGLDWKTRYRIIKGMCEGLRYLHEGLQSPVLHLDLEPSHILLDKKMMPKIGGFTSARLLDDERNISGARMGGHSENLPPEFIEKQVISKEYDIFSLGVIILELVAGSQAYYVRSLVLFPGRFFDEHVHAKWRERLQKTADVTLAEGYFQQVKKCLEIAVKCLERDRHKRPAIGDIVHMLNETETNLTPQLDSELLLHVHPLELCFLTYTSSWSSSSSLKLNNKGNDRVAFMFVANSPRRYLTKTPLFGIVPPRSVYTLALTLMPGEQPPSMDFFTLYSVAVGEYDLQDADKDSRFIEYDNFFNKAKETAVGGEVQERRLKVICDRGPSLFSFASAWFSSHGQPTRSMVEIIITPDAQQVSSIDVHPTEPWIMTTNNLGSLGVWSYHSMATLTSFQLKYGPVYAAKFIAREKWIIAGDSKGAFHVYSYHKHKDVKKLYAHDNCITTLVIHPTHPFVFSSSDDEDYLIKLWDWGKGWKCTRIFSGHTNRVMQVTINPEDEDRFASASLDGTVKIWRISSDEPNNIITLKLEHAESLLCVDYFTRLNRQHLIVGCKDKTAQIWELEMQTRVDMVEGHADHISVANFHPELSVLITGSLDGTVRVWNSTTYKIENITCFNLGAVYALGWLKGSSRIVVGCHQGMATMELSST